MPEFVEAIKNNNSLLKEEMNKLLLIKKLVDRINFKFF